MNLWHRIGYQLRHPTGLAGAIAGGVMAVANRRPNTLAIAALEIGPRDHILELGFGPGRAIEQMAVLAPFGKIYGIDQSSVMVAQAARRNARAVRSGRVFLRQGKFNRIPLPDDSVDKILAVNVVYFWIDAGTVLREMRRVLRPGGLISLYATDASTMRRWKFAGPDTHRHFEADDLVGVLRHGGFRDDPISIARVQVGLGVRGLIATIKRR
jgi:SAM-dependent methyltransferase